MKGYHENTLCMVHVKTEFYAMFVLQVKREGSLALVVLISFMEGLCGISLGYYCSQCNDHIVNMTS